jgi:hypothetical protein
VLEQLERIGIGYRIAGLGTLIMVGPSVLSALVNACFSSSFVFASTEVSLVQVDKGVVVCSDF